METGNTNEEIYEMYEQGKEMVLNEEQFKYCFDLVKKKQDLKELLRLMDMYEPLKQ